MIARDSVVPPNKYGPFSKKDTLKYMQGYGVKCEYYYEGEVRKQKLVWTTVPVVCEEIEKIIKLLEILMRC